MQQILFTNEWDNGTLLMASELSSDVTTVSANIDASTVLLQVLNNCLCFNAREMDPRESE